MLTVRGGPRESCLAFYNNFTKIDINYLVAGDNYKPSVPNLSKSLTLIKSKYYPAWGFDPVTSIQKRITNLSWANIKGM
jgi:hypothetical protein